MNKLKYRNGKDIKPGDIAIGCWMEGIVKLTATIVILDIDITQPYKPITFAYINGKPQNAEAVGQCSGYELMLLEDVFTGSII